MNNPKTLGVLIEEVAAKVSDGEKENFFLPLCSYSHDYDGAVYEEQICACGCVIKDSAYCLRRNFKERHDYETVYEDEDFFPITKEEMKLTKSEYCKLHCKNEWAFTYNIFERLD